MKSAAEKYLIGADPVLGEIILKLGPCSILEISREPFDVLASSIIGQQLSSKAADTIRTRLVRDLKINRPFAFHHFVKKRPSTLQRSGLSGAKASSILGIAKELHFGRLDFDRLAKLSDLTVIEELTKLRGVGPWTAEMFLIFGMKRPDVLALRDTGLRRAVKKLYAVRKDLTDARFNQIAKPWSPYRSVASWYLWRFIDTPD